MSAGKEVILFVLDVGPACWQIQSSDNNITPLDKAIQCVVTMLNHKIMEGRKTDTTGIILMNANNTNNQLYDDDGDQYGNISVVQPLTTPSYAMVRWLREGRLELGERQSSHSVDALVVAADLLIEHTKGKSFGSKRIVFFTGDSDDANTSSDDLKAIAKQINDAAISVDLILLGQGCCTMKELLFEGESLIQDALVYEIDEALESLSHFASRKVRQSAIFRGTLDIGVPLAVDEGEGEKATNTGISIPICLYGKTSMAKLPVAKKLRREGAAPVERSLTYHQAAQDGAGRLVEKEDLIKAYRYGQTLVPFHQIDQEQLAYKTVRGMHLLGFQSAAKLDRHLLMTGVWMMVGDEDGSSSKSKGKDSKKDALPGITALTALAQAAYEKGVVGVARYVRAASSPPRMVILVPHIKAAYSGFLVCGMPFAEDLRRFYFPPLFRGGDGKGEETKKELMRKWILASALEGDAFKPRTVYNPTYQRLFQCITHRVAHPDEPLPPCEPAILASVSPSNCNDEFEALKAAFPLSRIIGAKESGKIMRFWTDDSVKGISVAEADENPEILKASDDHKPVRRTVRPDHAIADFVEMTTNRFHDLVETAMTQMMQLIPRMATEEALECFRVLRETAIKVSDIQ